VGARLPAYATAMGRVLLAALSPGELEAYLMRARLEPRTSRTVTSAEVLVRILGDVARQGYALVDQELEDGVRSVAVPLHDRGGKVVAAMNVSGHATRTSKSRLLREFLPRLREAAFAIDAALGFRALP